jgi:hypothetical protein
MLRNDDRSAAWLPWLTILAGPAALFGGDLVRGRVLFWGTPLLQFGPWRLHALEMLRHGELPLWNNLVGMGAPLLANYQSALLYPPNWILAIVGVAWGQTLLVALHLVLAGAGMVALTRRLGVGLLGQAIGGAAYAMSGYLVSRSSFLSINAAAAWLPWIFLATEALCAECAGSGGSKPAGRRMLMLAAVLSLQWLSGHAQIAWYTLFAAGAWLLWRVASATAWRARGAMIAWFGAACLLAGSVAAAQLMPTLEYLSVSQRAGALNRDFALSYSFWPWRLTGLLAPGLFGTPARGTYWGYGNFWEDAVYIGTLPVLLALGQLIAGVRRRERMVGVSRWLLGMCLVSVLLALGIHTPVFPWLYEHVPTFASFQAPTRWMLLFVFGLALLGAAGADRWAPPRGRGLYWTRLGTAGAAAIGGFAWLGSILLGDVQPTFVRALAEMSVAVALAGGLSLLQPATRNARWSALVCGVVLVDLVFAGWGLNPTTDRSVYAVGVRESGAIGRSFISAALEQQVKFDDLFRFDRFEAAGDGQAARRAGLPNTLMLDGVPCANNFDPLVPARFAAWMETVEGLPPDRQASLLRLMGVDRRAERTASPGIEWVPLSGAARWRLIADAQWVGSEAEALAVVTGSEFDPETSVVLEGERRGQQGQGDAEGSIVILKESMGGEVTARIATRTGAWFVLSDVWYPGWKVRIDGQPERGYPADGVFRAAWVPGGEHEVEWIYRPPSFTIGAWVSGLGLILMGLVGLRCRRG